MLGAVAVLGSVEAAPREKRQILGAILENILGEGRGMSDYSHFQSFFFAWRFSCLRITVYGGHSGERFGGEYGRYGYPVYNQDFRNYPGYGRYSREHGGGYRHSHEIY